MLHSISPKTSREVRFTASLPSKPKKNLIKRTVGGSLGFIQNLLNSLIFPSWMTARNYKKPITERALREQLKKPTAKCVCINPKKAPDFGPWKLDRVAIRVDNDTIDVALLRRKDASKDNWILYSGGNGESLATTPSINGALAKVSSKTTLTCEELVLLAERSADRRAQWFIGTDVMKLGDKLKSNLLFFDLPSIGFSTGKLTPERIRRAYQGVLQYLENDDRGEGAKFIVGYGRSIGGAIQADAIDGHEWKPGIRYTMIKDRTFSNLSDVIKALANRFLAWVARIFKLNYETTTKSQNLPIPEVIVQCMKDQDFVIPSDCSLQSTLSKTANIGKKTFIEAEGENDEDIEKGGHNGYLSDEVIQSIYLSVRQGLAP